MTASYTDADIGDTHSFTIDTAVDATRGKVTNNGDGTFTYDPNGAFIGLKLGDTATDKFVYVVKDAAGTSSTATVTITIIGQNDVPIITSGAQSAVLTEDAHVNRVESGSGTVTFTDPDIGDVHSASFIAQGGGYVGLFTLDASKHDTKAGGEIGWNFSVPDNAIDHLSAGQTLTQKYTVTIDDGHGGQAFETVTVTISGTNDAPIITGGLNRADVAVGEGSPGAVIATGGIGFGDVDLNDEHIVSVQSHDPSGKSYFGKFDAVLVHDATDGGKGTVQWTYRIGSQGPNLDEGEKLVQLYDVVIDDGHGGKVTQIITITLIGAEERHDDDQPHVILPWEVHFDFPHFPEIKGSVGETVLQEPLHSLSYFTFSAFSGWMPHPGDANTKSVDPLPEDDGGYSPVPPSFTPWSHDSSPFSVKDLQKQLQLLNSTISGALPAVPPATTGTPQHSGEAPSDATQGPRGDLQFDQSIDRSHFEPADVTSQPVFPRQAPNTAGNSMTRAIESVVAVAAPMMLLQRAASNARKRPKSQNETSLGVSFTSAGGVKSVVFKLSYDAERLDVVGVEPGVDLPDAASVSLSWVPTDGIAVVRVAVASEEELSGGTVDLASLSVRYRSEARDGALKLISVDVNGEVAEANPVRIRFDSLPLDDDATDVAVLFDRQQPLGRAEATGGRVRISMDALAKPVFFTPEIERGCALDRNPIRIAVQDVMAETSGVVVSSAGPEHHWRSSPSRLTTGAIAGAVRIAADGLMKNAGEPGPRA